MKLITTGAEAKLVEYLTTSASKPKAGTAIHFHFSHLLEHYRSDYQVRIATNLLGDLLKEQEGGIYLFSNVSMLVLSPDIPRSLVEKAIFQLRYLFMDDPLAYTEDGQENPQFCTLYDLSSDYKALVSMARQRMLGSAKAPQTERSQAAAPQAGAAAGGGAMQARTTASASASASSATPKSKERYFDPDSLSDLEQRLRSTNLLAASRVQPICATVPNMAVRRVFNELYFHIPHITRLMATNIDILSNRWLLKYLSLTLDQHALSLILANQSRYLTSPISLNLNIHTVLSKAFEDFDRKLNPSVKISVVIEVQASDIFEDIYGYKTARDRLKKSGYRVCIDGLNHQSFALIDRRLLGADLIKLQWNANVPEDTHAGENLAVADAIQRSGANRIILTRCDNRSAVDYGQVLGVSLFQGRYIDELVNPQGELIN